MFVRSSRRILPLGLALLLAATAFGAQGSVPPGYHMQSIAGLAPGVDHETMTSADPAQSVHVARVAPGAARIVAVSSHDAVANQDVGAELPSDMCRRVGCLAGINADFSDPLTGQPLGGVVSGGRLLRSPAPGRPQLIVTRDGRFQAGPLDWSGAVAASDGRTAGIAGVNVNSAQDGIVLYTPVWGGATPAGADTEVVVRSSGAIGAIGATTRIEIIGVRSQPGPIPTDGAVLAGAGSASAVLDDLVAAADAGSISRTLDLAINTAVDAFESVGGRPKILQGGQFAFADVDDSFTRARHPRALVGWNPAGEVMLVTVDAGRPDASGMTLAEAADLLLGLGATDGFGFDNAAATFVAGGAVRNLPIDDGDPAAPPTEGREVAPGHMERPAANALMVVAHQSNPPAPPPANPGTGSGPRPGPGGGSPATTAPGKLTTAGGGPAPAGGIAVPTATAGTTLLPGVGEILRNPGTKRPRRPIGKGGKGGTPKDGEAEEEAYAGDPSIPDWNDITAALTPEAVAGTDRGTELSFGPDGDGPQGRGLDVGAALLQLVAAGMIVTVLWGLQRARTDSRPRPALWI